MTQKNKSRTITLPKIIAEEIERRAQAEGGDVPLAIVSFIFLFGIRKSLQELQDYFNSSKQTSDFAALLADDVSRYD